MIAGFCFAGCRGTESELLLLCVYFNFVLVGGLRVGSCEFCGLCYLPLIWWLLWVLWFPLLVRCVSL